MSYTQRSHFAEIARIQDEMNDPPAAREQRRRESDAYLASLAAEAEQQAKASAKRSWLGPEEEFNQQWPELWNRIRQQRVLQHQDEQRDAIRRTVRQALG